MDQGFHVVLDLGALGRNHLVILDRHRPRIGAQPVDTLTDDAVGLAHLFHAHQIAVITIAVHADRNIEIDLMIGRIGLLLAQIPFDAGAAQHGTGETELQCPLRRDHTDAHGALLPDAVVGEQGLVLIDMTGEAVGKVLDEIEQRAVAGAVALGDLARTVPLGLALVARHGVGQIAMHAARTIVAGVHARARDRLVAVEQILALAEAVEEDAHGADVERMGGEPHQVVQDARDLVEQRADVLRALRHLDAEQLLDGAHIAVLVAHHGHIVQTVHVADGLIVRLVFGQLFGAAMQQPDMRIGAFDDFAVHLQHQTQHAVRGRMLGAEVQGVIADLRHDGLPRRDRRNGCPRGSRGAPARAVRWRPAHRRRA